MGAESQLPLLDGFYVGQFAVPICPDGLTMDHFPHLLTYILAGSWEAPMVTCNDLHLIVCPSQQLPAPSYWVRRVNQTDLLSTLAKLMVKRITPTWADKKWDGCTPQVKSGQVRLSSPEVTVQLMLMHE